MTSRIQIPCTYEIEEGKSKSKYMKEKEKSMLKSPMNDLDILGNEMYFISIIVIHKWFDEGGLEIHG